AYAAAKSWTLSTGDGTKTVNAELKDAVGNVSVISDTITLDMTKPVGTLAINSGAIYTNSLSAALTLSSDDMTVEMRFSNDGTTWSGWESYAATKAWTLSTGDGDKTVHVQLKDAADNVTDITDTISVDMTLPTGIVTINGSAAITTDANVTVNVSSDDAGASASGVTQVNVSVDNGATWSGWEPIASQLQTSLAAGFGTKTVTIKLKDAAGNESAPISDSIDMRSIPVLHNHMANGTEDVPYKTAASDYAYTNADGTALSGIEIVSLPAHGKLQLSGVDVKPGDKLSPADASALTFIPEENWNGQTSLIWQGESDAAASAATAKLTLTIAAVNDAPVVKDLKLTTTDYAEVKGTLTSTDVDGDALTYRIVDQPATGTLDLDAATGAFTYKPAQTGTLTFTYRSFDGSAYSNTAVVTVESNLSPVIIPPTKPQTPTLVTVGGDDQSTFNDNLVITSGPTDLGNTVTVKLQGDKWAGDLPNKPGETIVLDVTSDMDAAIVELDSSMTDKLAEGQRGLTVQMGGHSITLPDKIMAQLAAQMTSKTAVLKIEIGEATDANADKAEAAAERAGAKIVASPMQYQVYIEDNGKRIDLSRFNGYLDISYTPEELNGAKPTTAALLMPNGKLRPLPTKFDKNSNNTDIRVHGLTQGTFVLIETKVKFRDASGHWASQQINDLAERLVINGVGEGMYQPNRTATRAEFASILVQAFGMYGITSEQNYSDTSADAWYGQVLSFASGYGIITGYADGSFRPNATITREEAMVIMARTAALLGLDAALSSQQIDQSLGGFDDADALHTWSRDAAALCISLGIVNGIGDDLQPGQPITRAQLAIMVEKLLQKADYI
ncbi:S-layer homology domain-containing protein, partial [Paenibacillus sp. CCS19]|uniref:S-layer homology domain-containing protein n=1 Tax=Paenibacillus sp. CCS19 TaxID=3158387 RepID=UPI00295EC613